LHPGLNNVVVNFWSEPNGTGSILQSLTADVVSTPTAAGTTINGTLTGSTGSMRLVAPSSYIPGIPFLVRADLLNGQGQLDRTAWNTTVTLSSSVQGITLPNITLNNGMGSALVTVGGSGGGGTSILVQPGGTAAARMPVPPRGASSIPGPNPQPPGKAVPPSTIQRGPLATCRLVPATPTSERS
jgi:hypothetical protein